MSARPPADTLSRLLRAASVELARLFGPLLRALRRLLASLRAAVLLPAHVARLSRLVLAGVRALAGASPSAQTSAGGLAPLPPLPRLLRAVIRAAAGLVTPAEADKLAAWETAQNWIDPNGFRLSERLWRDAFLLRRRIDRAIARGLATRVAPQELGDRIAAFLSSADGKTGGLGTLERLVHTEASRAVGQATIVEAGRQGKAVRWVVHTRHAYTDQCGKNARRDVGLGPGVYPAYAVPTFPSHPWCHCELRAV